MGHTPLIRSLVPLSACASAVSIGAAQGYWVAYHEDPVLHRDAGRHAGLPRPDAALLQRPVRSGRSRPEFQPLSTGFVPDFFGPITSPA